MNNLKNAWLASEARQKNFQGWNFAYLKDKMQTQKLPWSYPDLVKKHLRHTDHLLDLGTGGGELLATFQHPPHLTCVTEGWEPNYQLLMERLAPQGISVKFTEDECLPFAAETFEIVLASQSAFSLAEVKRVLKPGGIFITQQVGDLNGLPLAAKLIPNLAKESFDWHLSRVLEASRRHDFEILSAAEAYPAQYFYDLDGLIYYARTIPWEYPDFSVATHYPQLLALKEELDRTGKICNQQHRFMLILQK